MTKLVVFDKDGTLTVTKSGEEFPVDTTDQHARFKADGLDSNTIYAVASNQKGISLGYKDKAFVDSEFNYLQSLFDHQFKFHLICPDDGLGVAIKDFAVDDPKTLNAPPKFKYYTANPVIAEAEGGLAALETAYAFKIKSHQANPFRKPSPGMLALAEAMAKQYLPDGETEFESKLYLGDMDSDRQAAKNAGWQYQEIMRWLGDSKITHIPSRAQIDRIKQEWEKDPTWDLGESVGFEIVADELREYQEQVLKERRETEYALRLKDLYSRSQLRAQEISIAYEVLSSKGFQGVSADALFQAATAIALSGKQQQPLSE